jgi:DNA primase
VPPPQKQKRSFLPGFKFSSFRTGVRLFDNSILNEIRSRLDLVEIVADYVSLKKAGRNFKGLCPFHAEKTPSFIVSPEKQIFHCFGCHEGGDLFRFVMQMEGLNFPETIERLAQKSGLEIRSQTGPTISKDEKEMLFQANRVAAWHYHENLKKSPAAEKARAYLIQRGVTSFEIEKFRLGYALPHSDELQEIYHQRKIPLEAALKVGVLREGERGFFEAFRGRLIFPIFNREGKVVGLGGRILETQTDLAKYINSSDSPIYDKSSTLFGLPLAKEAIRKKNRVFIVEGYLDVIAMHQFGFEESVAPLGTALTVKQISTLKRYIDEIIVLFDGDEAGWKATERSLDLFLEQEISPKVLVLPPGEDPDSYLRKQGVQTFEEKLKKVSNLLSTLIDKTLAKNDKDISGKASSIADLKPYLLKVSRPLERNLYIRRVAEGLDVPEAWVFEELGLKPMSERNLSSEKANKIQTPSAEELLLELFTKFEGLRRDLLDKVEPSEFLNEEMRNLAIFLWNQVGVSSRSFLEILGETKDEKMQNLLSSLVLKESRVDEANALSVAHDCIKKMKMNRFKQKLGELSLQIKEAEAHHQLDRLSGLLKEKQNILVTLGD